jgi:hypothetical protein
VNGLVEYFSFTFIHEQKKLVCGVVSTNAGDAWAQLGIKLGSLMLREGWRHSAPAVSLGFHPPGAMLTPRDQQIGQQ